MALPLRAVETQFIPKQERRKGYVILQQIVLMADSSIITQRLVEINIIVVYFAFSLFIKNTHLFIL